MSYALASSSRQLGDEYVDLNNIVFHSIVSKNKQEAHNSISNALLNVKVHNSKEKHYIYVEHGTYDERIEIPQYLTTNIVLVGDKTTKPIIQCNRHAPNFSTQDTGTISVKGDGFIAMNISFVNTAGDVGQAAAAVVTANHVAFYNCSFHGYQDTLYAQIGTQFYKNCDIYGTVDFICGAAAAVFQDCSLYAVKRTNGVSIIEFTAQQRVSPAPEPPSGFVIQNCKLTVAPGLDSKDFKAFLGRPWSKYSTVIVMESFLDKLIQPVGWDTWPDRAPTNEVCYREFNNSGPSSIKQGSKTHQRASWNGGIRIIFNPEEIKNFTVGEFINKDGWLAGTKIPHYDGFYHEYHFTG